ncbi:glycosyltransferase family 1 protein [Lachnospiraceae bacterium]|nr:glycosyltransferase family 1 protein [Lachnospiraceae bacterium]
MEEIICYTVRLPEGEEQKVSFLELLLDERWAEGRMEYPPTCFVRAGDINRKLTAKRTYEFLLRAIRIYPMRAIGVASSAGDREDCSKAADWENYRTDVYVAARYQKELLSSGYFDMVMENLLTTASRLPEPQAALAWLEKMISHDGEYYEIEDDTAPILVYRQADVCYNTLNQFADELVKALQKSRQIVEVFDLEKEGHQALDRYIGRRFKAVIGMQTYAFSIMMGDGRTNLHDLITGPKYNVIFDHPVMMKKHMEHGPQCYYMLSHDRNYLAFAKRYYKRIKDCIYFPPAGMLLQETAVSSWSTSRPFDVSFIGSYINYRGLLPELYAYAPSFRFLAAHAMRRMRRCPNETAEEALAHILEERGLKLKEDEFLNLFFQMRYTFICIMSYYREKIVRALLDAGIELQVYGDSWNYAPFAQHPCLKRHTQVNIRESLQIMRQSKISLNVMSWHKDGLTERLLNSMLCKSVVLSDSSRRLKEEFTDQEDLILFDLQELNGLPGRVKRFLEDHERLQRIAENGYHKAVNKHLWTNRAEQFLRMNERHRRLS